MSMGNLMGSCVKQLKRLGAMMDVQHYITGSQQSPSLETHREVRTPREPQWCLFEDDTISVLTGRKTLKFCYENLSIS
jgi:hypothetical protein